MPCPFELRLSERREKCGRLQKFSVPQISTIFCRTDREREKRIDRTHAQQSSTHRESSRIFARSRTDFSHPFSLRKFLEIFRIFLDNRSACSHMAPKGARSKGSKQGGTQGGGQSSGSSGPPDPAAQAAYLAAQLAVQPIQVAQPVELSSIGL